MKAIGIVLPGLILAAAAVQGIDSTTTSPAGSPLAPALQPSPYMAPVDLRRPTIILPPGGLPATPISTTFGALNER